MRGWLVLSLTLACACDGGGTDAAPVTGPGSAGQFPSGAAGMATMDGTGTMANPSTQAGSTALPLRDGSMPVVDSGARAVADGGSDDAGEPEPPMADAGAKDAATPDAGVLPPGMPGTFKLFDKIPQFGIYRTDEPRFTPPPGVLMWERGTLFVAKLSREQQQQIGADLKARITYHAQCDNYDRIGGAFFIVKPRAEMPSVDDPRVELARFMTPFSNFMRGALATYPFAPVDLSAYARTLADPGHDVWIGIGGGSNPYDGDPCTNTNQPASFKEIGFLYSLELVSSEQFMPGAGASTTIGVLYSEPVMRLPIDVSIDAPAGGLTGSLRVIVSGHGAEAGGNEYRYTQNRVSVNGVQVGSFSTQVDCAMYGRFSPDGNQGIFRNNGSGNPRNWCPGGLVQPQTFAARLMPGPNQVRLEITPNQLPQGSYYATSISFSTQ